MKKLSFLLIIAITFCVAGCKKSNSDSGEFTPKIDKLTFKGNESTVKISNGEDETITEQSSLFELVPGSVKVSWDLYKGTDDTKRYQYKLTMKLKLKKSVKVDQEVYNKINNPGNSLDALLLPYRLFHFYLADVNGKQFKGLTMFRIGEKTIKDKEEESVSTAATGDTEEGIKFMKFLESQPGTEYELTLYTQGMAQVITNTENLAKDIEEKTRMLFCEFHLSDSKMEKCGVKLK